MRREIFFLFVIFSLSLLFGCINTTQKTKETKVVTQFPFNGSTYVNGKEGNKISLISEQTVNLMYKFKNVGTKDLENLNAITIGCLETSESNVDHYDKILPGQQLYFMWTLQAPLLGSNEKISCPQTIRVCFESESSGYSDLVYLPENWNSEFSAPSSGGDKENIAVTVNFPVIRVLKDKDNTITGEVIIDNIGNGWIDYRGEDQPDMNTLKYIEIKLSKNSKAKIVGIFDLKESDLSTYYEDASKKSVKINENELSNDKKYLLELIQGKELRIPVKIEVPASESGYYQSEPVYEGITVNVGYGYCIDVASVDVTMSGR